MTFRKVTLIAASLAIAVLLISTALLSVFAWSEETNLDYFDPLDYRPLAERVYTSPEVSSIHFDLVGALAIAAGFSITDAATMQTYSQLLDAGQIPSNNPVYALNANPVNYPTPPPITSVVTNTMCLTPSQTGPTVTMGTASDMMTCPGCFSDRFGPYGVFFHMPHNTPDELGAIRDWAWGATNVLTGKVTFGYSSTSQFEWQGIANVYETTPCFTQETHIVDTGDVQAGSLEAFGLYLHSFGDNLSHGDCLKAADNAGYYFAAHVSVIGLGDPLWDCRWTHHEYEFGDPAVYHVLGVDSPRTLSAVYALYNEIYNYALASNRIVYRPIPITAENNYISDTIKTFVYTNTATAGSQQRRIIADDLRNWALQTRANSADYWLYRVYLPVILR